MSNAAATACRRAVPSLTIAAAPIDHGFRADEVLATIFVTPAATLLSLGQTAGARPVGEGDLVLLLPGDTLRVHAHAAIPWLHLSAPRRFLSPALPGPQSLVISRSATTEAFVRHITGLRRLLSLPVEPAQVRFMASGVRELLTAATAGCVAATPFSLRRDEEILERIVAHVDARLTEKIGIAGLCQALGYSRSALYRAAAPLGGLLAVTMQRRLVAVYRDLRCPDDRRSIAEIARAYGFTDPSLFSRRFRRAFGVSAGQVRAAGAGLVDGLAFDPGRHVDAPLRAVG